MSSHSTHLLRFASSSALLILLTATWLPAPRAFALPVFFDAPSGFGVSEAMADAAITAGFERLTPAAIQNLTPLGLAIPEPTVLDFDISDSPSTSDPTAVTSRWTVQNGGDRAFVDAWLIFLSPTGYPKPQVGVDLQPGEWGIVEMTVGSGEGSTEYFYPAVRLGSIAAGGNVQFLMHHVVATALTQTDDDPVTFLLPRYGVGVIGTVPAPAALPLLSMLLTAIALRRWSAA
jgi:hypothetical protein